MLSKEKMDLDTLPEKMLQQIAMGKGKNGCATKQALRAQKILWERVHWPCANNPYQHRDCYGNKYTKTGTKD